MNHGQLICPFTDIKVDKRNHADSYLYEIPVGEKTLKVMLPSNFSSWKAMPFFKDNRHIFAGLFLNGQIVDFDDNYPGITVNRLEEVLLQGQFPKTNQEKYDNLFFQLYGMQGYDGQPVAFYDVEDVTNPFNYKKLFFKTPGELLFYTKSLEFDNLILCDHSRTKDSPIFYLDDYSITFKGLSYAVRLENEGSKSKSCFIAMSFGKEMGPIRAAIKEACIATGYSPVVIDEVHFESDTTINDAIIANLRKSRFCIADFTEQKMGVYFESGFALGQGKQVIYSVRKDWADRSHFDTNHFPHIRYNDPEELKQALINKIRAWIR
ncbi:TIR domain-containing protein [Spirosoma endbachense]|uniref:Nucleoside 2-deoxyribosyltransferase n=1 Tax=Spirosoma endbachense TaxID=2666025 RepID=A0A6P1VZ88_9BACT|nr:hypothetical protein [Spirosoma endbachense]QHV97944.1 hypothetical protein GJR95_24340 [Spirosoma endbachense]